MVLRGEDTDCAYLVRKKNAMNRKQTTKRLSEQLEEYLNPNCDPRIYIAKEVTFDYGTPMQRRVDYMRFRPLNNTVSGIEKGNVYCYEIKSCPEDFASAHGHNLIGDYNYYVMPYETYEKVRDKMAYRTGVICPDGNALRVIKKAGRVDRSKPLVEILLMMFRSSNRENIQKKKSENQ